MAAPPKKYPRKSEAAKKREANKPLTLRQSRFAKAVMKSKSAKDAAIAAGYFTEVSMTRGRRQIGVRHDKQDQERQVLPAMEQCLVAFQDKCRSTASTFLLLQSAAVRS